MKIIFCATCKEWFEEGSNHYQSSNHIDKCFLLNESITLIESALKNRLRTYFLKNFDLKQLDLTKYLRSNEPLLQKTTREILEEFHPIKINLLTHLQFVKPEEDGINQRITFKTKNKTVYMTIDLKQIFKGLFNEILQENEDFYMTGSGWVLEKILGSELRVNRLYNLSRGSNYFPLPYNSNFVINVKIEDERCFYYAVMGKFLRKDIKNKNSPSVYKSLPKVYDSSMLDFPVGLDQISKFEKANNISISVFTFRSVQEGDKYKKILVKSRILVT